jgi:SAM-dependent methyltransferase
MSNAQASNREPEIAGYRCWICGNPKLTLAKHSNIENLTSEAFGITDSHYGSTGEIHRCSQCGFLQCSKLDNVLGFYENMADTSYEEGREVRSLQCVELLKTVQRFQPKGRLLDIGAGTGMLVEQALKVGYDAVGVEPSKWLQGQAAAHGLPVHLGIFPHPDVRGPFDVITLVDVIEHVPDPVGLLAQISKCLSPEGVALVVTPDVSSLAARLLGFKWWHFRIAHIGYFNRKNLTLALQKGNLAPRATSRPAWFFTGDYLAARVVKYLPKPLRIAPPGFVKRMVIPLNLRDSLAVIVKALPLTGTVK